MTHAEHGWPDDEPEASGRDEGTPPDEGSGPDESTGADRRGRPVRPASEADMLLDNDPLLELAAGDEPDASQRPRAGQEHPAELVEARERERFAVRWQEIQAGFVDDPGRAVQDADSLVAGLVQRLAQLLAAERERLGSPPGPDEDVSTEELRQALRRYRSLFERLLAA